MAGAGLSATACDLARFGELMRREGEWSGRQLIPASVLHDVQRGGDPTKFNYTTLPGYRSQWWVTQDELGTFLGRGMHGQVLYVAPKAGGGALSVAPGSGELR